MTARAIQLFNNIMTPYTSRLWEDLAGDYRVMVCSCAGQEANRNWADDFTNRFEHIVLKGLALRLNPARYAHVNVGVWKQVRRFRPDLVICNGFYPTMVIVALVCLVLGLPFVIQNDGWAETMPATPYHRIFRTFMLRRCHGVIACSEKGGDYFRSQGVPADRVFVAPLAPAWDAPAQVPAGADRRFDLLWVAQANSTIKNCLFFTDVVAELARRRPGLAICVVGSGPDKAEMMARLAALPVKLVDHDKVRWDEIAGVFAASRLMVLPSRWEPWGLVCNEAMQCGTPCLVSPHVGAGGELVGEPAGAVLPLTVTAWADAAERLLDPAAWQVASHEARARVARFDFAHYRDAYRRAFASLLALPQRGKS